STYKIQNDMKKFTFVFIFSLLSSITFAQNAFFTKADAFLKKNVSNGNVKYASIKANPSELNELVKMVENYALAGQSSATKKAFYLNAYNISVIKGIIDKYPVAGPMKIAGFFDKVKHTVAGKQITLNDLENKIIRPTYQDARIHFALVCAAKGCPKIVPFAFTPSQVDSQLTKVTKKAMDDAYFIRLKGNKVQYSQIFDWYKQDFLNEASSIVAYINKYRTTKIPEKAKTSVYTYDWALNKI
ncbi:MAG: DUF547 domain-containing protein, partial [Flammeovirgaceae bacterium]